MGVPVTVAMGNAYYVIFCAHGNSLAHAYAYSHGHAHHYVHRHVHYWQTCSLEGGADFLGESEDCESRVAEHNFLRVAAHFAGT